MSCNLKYEGGSKKKGKKGKTKKVRRTIRQILNNTRKKYFRNPFRKRTPQMDPVLRRQLNNGFKRMQNGLHGKKFRQFSTNPYVSEQAKAMGLNNFSSYSPSPLPSPLPSPIHITVPKKRITNKIRNVLFPPFPNRKRRTCCRKRRPHLNNLANEIDELARSAKKRQQESNNANMARKLQQEAEKLQQEANNEILAKELQRKFNIEKVIQNQLNIEQKIKQEANNEIMAKKLQKEFNKINTNIINSAIRSPARANPIGKMKLLPSPNLLSIMNNKPNYPARANPIGKMKLLPSPNLLSIINNKPNSQRESQRRTKQKSSTKRSSRRGKSTEKSRARNKKIRQNLTKKNN